MRGDIRRPEEDKVGRALARLCVKGSPRLVVADIGGREPRFETRGVELVDHGLCGVARQPEPPAQPPITRQRRAQEAPIGGEEKAVVLAEAKERRGVRGRRNLRRDDVADDQRAARFQEAVKQRNSALAPVAVRYCTTECMTMRSSECSGSRASSCGAMTRIFG